MKLIIGGACQGKLDYAKNRYEGIQFIDGNTCDMEEIYRSDGINHFEAYIQRMLKEEKTSMGFAKELIEKNPNLVVISNEIGYGLVPIDKFEREYREYTGRVLTELAAYAERVDRVVCGIGMRIK